MDNLISRYCPTAFPFSDLPWEPIVRPELPDIFRVTAINHATSGRAGARSTATLFHERAAINVSWLAALGNPAIKSGDLVTPAWFAGDDCYNGATRIFGLALVDTPTPDVNLFETVPPGWTRNRTLVRNGIALVEQMPERYRHLFNAVLWEPMIFRLFCRGPSSVNHHHSRVSGNLEHSVDVANRILDLCKQHPKSRPELCILLALLHDVGKAVEYRFAANGSWAMTQRGIQLGHDHTRTEWLAEAYKANPTIAIPEPERLEIYRCYSARDDRAKKRGIRREPAIERMLLREADGESCRLDLRKFNAANDPIWE